MGIVIIQTLDEKRRQTATSNRSAENSRINSETTNNFTDDSVFYWISSLRCWYERSQENFEIFFVFFFKFLQDVMKINLWCQIQV